jgi:hypothetical protein
MPSLRIPLLSAALGVLVVAGCSSSTTPKTPQQAVEQAITALGQQSSLGARFSLGITAAQAQQISAKSGSSITAAEAKALSEGSFFFDIQTGNGEALDSKQVATDTKTAFDIGLQLGSDAPIEVRYVDQNLYVRAQIGTLLSDVGQNPASASSFQSGLSKLDTYVPGLGALGQGQWVEATHASLHQLGTLLKQYESSLGASQPSASQLQALSPKLRKDFDTSFQATSTYQNLGTSNGRTEYGLTLQVHNFLTQFGPELQTDLSSLPLGVGNTYGGDVSKAAAKVPVGQTAVLDLYVSNSKLDEADLDLNQFASAKDKMSFPVPLRVALSSPPQITAPSGATPLDLSKLPALIQQIVGSRLGGTSSG